MTRASSTPQWRPSERFAAKLASALMEGLRLRSLDKAKRNANGK